MNDNELLRVIEYVERLRQPYRALFPMADPDPVWNIIVHLVRSHLRGDTVSISKLALAAEVPYATAMRRIDSLVQSGLIERRVRGRGRSFCLQPGEALLSAFLSYARQVKSVLSQTVGLRPGQEREDDFYFGHSRLDEQLAPPPALLKHLGPGTQLRFLMHADTYFGSMQNLWADYRSIGGSRRDFDLRPLPALYDRLVENAAAAESEYDVVTLNVPWLGEAVQRGFIRRAEDFVYRAGIDSLDFDPTVWVTGRWCGHQEAVPIFSSVEILAVRDDLFGPAGLPLPRTFGEVLAAGRAFHAPAKGRYGLTWNGQRGMPLASSFAFFLACCGGAVLGLPRDQAIWSLEAVDPARVPVTVNGEAARRTLDYMQALLAISPPNVLEMGWDTALDVFMAGDAAMTYCWSMRAARLETEVRSKVKRRVRYLPQPAGPGGNNVSPLGGFLLAVPANLPPARVDAAFEAIRWMTSPEAIRTHIQTGFPVLPRFSMSADPEIAASTPMVHAINELARRNLLQTWMRPPIPQYRQIEMIIGDEIHAALIGEKPHAAALERCQSRIERLLRSVP